MQKNRFVKVMLVILSVVITVSPTSFAAVDVTQLYRASNGLRYFDESGVDCLSSSASSRDTSFLGTSGADNLDRLMKFFIGKGLPIAAAAGIAGNIKQESGFNPAVIQGGKIALSNYTPVNGVGFGLAQWTFRERQRPLVAYAQSTGKPITDIDVQLNFMWQELTGAYKSATLERMMQETDPMHAAYTFHKYYEGSADTEAQIRANRMDSAKKIYDKYKSTTTGVTLSATNDTGVVDATTPASEETTPSNVSTDGCGISSTNLSATDGSKATFVTKDGYAVYIQTDPRWANSPYSTSTIGNSACGPASMAMIITALTGNAVDMEKIAKEAASGGIYVPGQGSMWTVGPYLAEKYGLSSKKIAHSVDAVNAALREGGYVLLSGQGSLPFTSGGHYVHIRGLTPNGKWLIGDSAHKAVNSMEWDPADIVSRSNDNFVEIYKRNVNTL